MLQKTKNKQNETKKTTSKIKGSSGHAVELRTNQLFPPKCYYPNRMTPQAFSTEAGTTALRLHWYMAMGDTSDQLGRLYTQEGCGIIREHGYTGMTVSILNWKHGVPLQLRRRSFANYKLQAWLKIFSAAHSNVYHSSSSFGLPVECKQNA